MFDPLIFELSEACNDAEIFFLIGFISLIMKYGVSHIDSRNALLSSI